MKQVLVLPGDGIGQEVMTVAEQVMGVVAAQEGVEVRLQQERVLRLLGRLEVSVSIRLRDHVEQTLTLLFLDCFQSRRCRMKAFGFQAIRHQHLMAGQHQMHIGHRLCRHVPRNAASVDQIARTDKNLVFAPKCPCRLALQQHPVIRRHQKFAPGLPTAQRALAELYMRTGRAADAEPMALEALTRAVDELGGDSPAARACYRTLSRVLEQSSRRAQADQWWALLANAPVPSAF